MARADRQRKCSAYTNSVKNFGGWKNIGIVPAVPKYGHFEQAFGSAPCVAVDGLRLALIGVAHFGGATDLAVLSALTAILLVFGAYLFSKIQL